MIFNTTLDLKRFHLTFNISLHLLWAPSAGSSASQMRKLKLLQAVTAARWMHGDRPLRPDHQLPLKIQINLDLVKINNILIDPKSLHVEKIYSGKLNPEDNFFSPILAFDESDNDYFFAINQHVYSYHKQSKKFLHEWPQILNDILINTVGLRGTYNIFQIGDFITSGSSL